MLLLLLLILPCQAAISEMIVLPIEQPVIITTDNHKDDIRRLEQGKPVERELQGGEHHSYQISLTTGQYLHIVVQQKGIDVVVSIFDPDENKLAEVDSPNGVAGPEPLFLVTERAGDYRLEVRSPEEKVSPGKYEINIAELRPAIAKDTNLVAAQKLFAEGSLLSAQGMAESSRQAIAKYQAALLEWRIVGNQKMEAETLARIGIIYNFLGENQTALDYFNQVLLILRSVDNKELEVITLRYIGGIYNLLGESQKALDCATQALSLVRLIGNQNLEASILSGVGVIYRSLGENLKALDYFNQALILARSIGDRYNEALVLNSMSVVYRSLGEDLKALDHLNQALPLARTVADQGLEADILTGIGTVYYTLGENQKALDYFNQALVFLRTLGARRLESYALNNIGSIYDSLGEYQRALDYYNQALALRRATGDRSGEANTLTNIGRIYKSLGEYQKALDYFNQAMVLEKAASNRRLEANTLGNIGVVYSSLGEYEKALDYYNQALLLFHAVGDRELEANTLNNIGRTYSILGENQKAVDYFNQALLLGKDIGNRTVTAVALFGIARFKRDSGELKAALTLTEQALTIIESLRSKFDIKELRASYSASVHDRYEFYIDLLMRLHQEQPAAGYDALALQASERARARTLLEALAEARVDIRQGINPDLLERERNLRQELNVKAEYLFRLLNSKHTTEQEDTVRRDTERITDELQKVEALIYKNSPHYAALKYPQPLTSSEIQQQVLDDNTLLLEYALGSEQSYLWAVTTNSITSYKLPKRADVEAAALRVYQLFIARPRKSFETNKRLLQRLKRLEVDITEATAQLSRMVLAPVAEHLNKKRLLIVSEGLLQYVPFAALPIPNSLDKPTRRYRFSTPLIINHEVINLPSASSLALQREELAVRPIAPKEIAIFANPVFSIQDRRVKVPINTIEKKPDNVATNSLEKILSGLEPIPETEQMAKEIISLLPKSASRLLLGFDANLTMATQQEIGQYKIVHYATHGFLNPNPELSGIVLSLFNAEGKQQQGFLSAAAIFNLNLPADLVVLSACRSGLALAPEESDNPRTVKQVLDKSKDLGLTGLTRGFVYAGAARVMVTLWNIPVTATTELMVRFYKQMLGTKKLSAVAALRAAQIQMLKQPRWQNPYYWAAFVINGEYR
ncbi:MAG: tetratricopeptide repeat protein [Acidobacteriota bacterium]